MNPKLKILINLFLLVLLSAALRMPTFFLSHINNDEFIHIGLAMKVDKYAFKVFKNQYNLYNIDKNIKGDFIDFSFTKEKLGKLIAPFGYWEKKTLSHHPPLFSTLLVLSHRIFAKNKPYVLARTSFKKENIYFQFYACIIPFIFSILLILATYFLGRILFNDEIGFLSAFLFSITPTDLLTSQKIWAEDMAVFFSTLAIIFYFYCLKNKKAVFACLSGIACGLSVLTKMNGGFVGLAIIIFHFWQNRESFFNKKVLNIVFERNILLFFLFLLLVIWRWLYIYISSFGSVSFYGHFIHTKINLSSLPQGFMRLVHSRPWYTYFISIPYQVPFYFLIYPAIAYLIREKKKEIRFLFSILFVFFILLTFKADKEERYLMPCFPAIAVISSYIVFKLIYFIQMKKLYFLQIIFIFIFILCVWHSLYFVRPFIFGRADIIHLPF